VCVGAVITDKCNDKYTLNDSPTLCAAVSTLLYLQKLELLYAAPELLATMSDDEVVPFRFWDEQDTMRRIVMEFTYRFDDVLDAQKLKSSLERLLKIGEWRGLGARFKKSVSSPRY
jgi:hypothetical protein